MCSHKFPIEECISWVENPLKTKEIPLLLFCMSTLAAQESSQSKCLL